MTKIRSLTKKTEIFKNLGVEEYNDQVTWSSRKKMAGFNIGNLKLFIIIEQRKSFKKKEK